MEKLIQLLKEPWPWYVTGPLIGLMVPALLILTNRHFGISTTFRHLCAACIPTKNEFFNYDWKKESWMLFLAGGIIIGGLLGGQVFANEKELVMSSDTRELFFSWGLSDFKQFAPAELFDWSAVLSLNGFLFLILGGFMIGFGTRWANGCTAGHAIMGLSLLNPGSLVAVIGFFIGGLFVSHIVLPLMLTV